MEKQIKIKRYKVIRKGRREYRRADRKETKARGGGGETERLRRERRVGTSVCEREGGRGRRGGEWGGRER